MKVNTIAIDLAKNVFQLLGVDEHGKTLFSKRLNRSQFHSFMTQQPPCTVVMEACLTSHYWGRCFLALGHDVKLIPAQHVTPFVRGNKNDKNDCMAIYEASQRPNIRFVPVKSEHQQSILALHRKRERLIHARTATINQTKALLLEFGVLIGGHYKTLQRELHQQRDNDALTPVFKLMLNDVIEELAAFDHQINRIEQVIKQFNAQSPVAQILLSLPGIGLINASAYSASIDRGQAFNSADDFAVWLGLTPRQTASGHVNRLGSITKRGDGYLRKQLIHGARAVVNHAHKKQDDLNRWITTLKDRRGRNKAVVATARRLARLMWILLQKNTVYVPQFTQAGTHER